MTEIALPGERARVRGLGATALVLAIAALRLAVGLAAVGRYGYFRDELYYIACSKHLAWGFVDQPPLSLALLALNRAVFGDSLLALRWLPILAGAATVVVAGLVARRLGAGRWGQALAALAVALAPGLAGTSIIFSMNAFDLLLCSLALYLLVVILGDDRPRLWPVFGAVAGLGLLNKYSMGFVLAGLAAGLLLTGARRHLRTASLWIGAGIAGALFLPHVLWEVRNGVPSLEFIRNAALLKNAPLSPAGFVLGVSMHAGPVQVLLAVAGLALLLAAARWGRFRALGWTALVFLAIVAAGRGKPYYVGPVIPFLAAAGAAGFERAVRARALAMLPAAAVVAALGVVTLPIALPLLPIRDYIRYQSALGFKPASEERSALGVLPQYFADMFGWEEWARTFARAAEALTPAERSDYLIYVRNYGEAGAVDFFGPALGLPGARCPHNSYWFWGPGSWDGRTALIVGISKDPQKSLDDLRPHFESVEIGATFRHPYAMPYENGKTVFVCRGFRHAWDAAFWKTQKDLI